MNKLLSLLLSAVIILSGFTFAYADDPEEALPPSSGASVDLELPTSNLPVTLTDEETIQSDLVLRQFSVNLARSIGAPNGTETAADIYNLLYDVITHDPSGFSYFRVYDTDTHVFLQRIINILTDYSGTSSNTESPFYTSGNASSRLSIAQLLLVLTTNVLDLVEMDSSGSSSSLVQYLVNCYNTYISINGKLSSILNCLTDDYGMTVANRLYDIKSVLFDMRGNELYYTKTWIGDIKNFLNNDIVPKVNHIDSDLHDIKQWFDDTFYYVDQSISQSDYVSRINLNMYGGPNGVYQYPFTGDIYASMPNDGGLKCIIPLDYIIDNHCIVCFPFNENVRVSISDVVSDLYSYNCSLYEDRQYYQISTQNFSNLNIEYSDCILKIEFDISDSILNQYNYMFFVIGNKVSISGHVENMIPYTFAVVNERKSYIEHIDNDLHLGYNILSQFKELYASDDLIAAKQDQQAFEDQVIDDFTGSGSAAAKASDAASAKDISSAVSSGLNSGGSVNNSLSVFNPSGGFWGWFSQENSDYINNLSSQTRLRSSGSGSDWVIDDPYQRNAEELQSILGGDK